jgi:hypothetical protein
MISAVFSEPGMHKRALTADKDIQTLKSPPVRAAVRNERKARYPLDNEVGS